MVSVIYFRVQVEASTIIYGNNILGRVNFILKQHKLSNENLHKVILLKVDFLVIHFQPPIPLLFKMRLIGTGSAGSDSLIEVIYCF